MAPSVLKKISGIDNLTYFDCVRIFIFIPSDFVRKGKDLINYESPYHYIFYILFPSPKAKYGIGKKSIPEIFTLLDVS